MEKLSTPKVDSGRRESGEQMLEDAFVSVVQERIIETMSEALEEAGFTPEQERTFRKHLASLPLQDINGVLSIPYELRHMRLSKLHERVEDGTSVAEIVDSIAREARERKFTIGYHMSNAEIAPVKTAKSEAWAIDGREQDHRDSDLPMAYYSTDLANLYDKKRARFLYIIRADMGPETTHKQDNDGTWGRAGKLDIVERLGYEDVMREARERVRREPELKEVA